MKTAMHTALWSTIATFTLLMVSTVNTFAQSESGEFAPFSPETSRPTAPMVPEPTEPGPAHPDAALRVYDVGDITGLAAAEEAHTLAMYGGLATASQSLQEKLEEVDEQRRRAVVGATDLAKMITAYIVPSFDELPGQARSVGGASLVVHSTPEQQRWVEGFLAKQREPIELITLTAHVLSAPSGFFEGLGYESSWDFSELTEQRHGEFMAAIDAAQVRVVTSPVVTTLPRQRGSMTVGREESVVADWEVRTVQPGNRQLADPVIHTLKEGVFLDLQGVHLPDGSLGLDIGLRHCETDRPLEVMEVTLEGIPEKLEVTLPTQRIVEVATKLVMARETKMVFVCRQGRNEEETAVLIELGEARAEPSR